MDFNKLKEAGVSIHIIATGAGAGIQQKLWETPGSSAYLSGASFPYSVEEQEELLGFAPEHFCSQEAAVDLASAAYMKAYTFGGKRAVGVGLTATVASEKEHRGDHRAFACIITDDKISFDNITMIKGSGKEKRMADGEFADWLALNLIEGLDTPITYAKNVSQIAIDRFFLRPFFAADGKRFSKLPDNPNWALMSGAFNPPHQGHFGVANQAHIQYGTDAVYEVCTIHPIKAPLTVQQMLQRAKMLRGHPTLFTELPMYIDKARAYPNTPLIVGADAMLRLLDPHWGDPKERFAEFTQLDTEFFIASRMIDNKLITKSDIMKMIPFDYDIDIFNYKGIKGQWDISSSEIRNKIA